MGMQFCEDCGNLLPISRNPEVRCDCCSKMCKNALLSTVSVSSTNNFPSELRNKTTVKRPQISSLDTWSKTAVKCPECDAPEVRYTALQLRSADEGTTMFYACPQCSARWNEDN